MPPPVTRILSHVSAFMVDFLMIADDRQSYKTIQVKQHYFKPSVFYANILCAKHCIVWPGMGGIIIIMVIELNKGVLNVDREGGCGFCYISTLCRGVSTDPVTH